MSQKKIDNIFSRQSSLGSLSSSPRETGYHKRTRSSPEASVSVKRKTMANQPVTKSDLQNMKDELMAFFCKMLDTKLDGVATKEDIKSVQNDVSYVSNENKQLKEELQMVKQIVHSQAEQISFFDNISRRNNVIIKGFNVSSGDNLTDAVSKFFKEVLGIEKDLEIDWVKQLGGGPSSSRPLKVSFSRFCDKMLVLKKTSSLRGTSWRIDQDFSFEIRKKRAKLFRLCWKIRSLSPQLRTSVRGDRLLVDGAFFSWDGTTGLMSGSTEGTSVLSSKIGTDLGAFIQELKAVPVSGMSSS